jgi:predicted RNA-binding protein with TRAM domain
MAEIPESLQSLFTSQIEEHNGRYLLEIPKGEIENGAINPSEPHRVAILNQDTISSPQQNDTEQRGQETDTEQAKQGDSPPVEEGEHRTVTIDNVGEQGDGIARVERGYVVIVPEAKPDDTVEIEIENVRENVAFADVIEHKETATAQL